jgi:hypothetical protein
MIGNYLDAKRALATPLHSLYADVVNVNPDKDEAILPLSALRFANEDHSIVSDSVTKFL